MESSIDAMATDEMPLADGDAVPVEFAWRDFRLTWWEILHVISSVTGIVGNFLVIVVLNKRKSSNWSTDTLILALAQADFLTSIFVFPLPQAQTVPLTPLGKLYCKMTLPGFCLFVCFTASIYILMSISVERFIAVVYPLHFNRLVSRRHILSMVIATMWFCSFVVYLVMVTAVVQVDPSRHNCILKFETPAGQAAFGCFMVAYRLIIPASVMLVTQIGIAYSLNRSSKRFSEQTFHIKARNRVLKLMGIVIVIYIACWGPGQIFYLLYSVGAVSPHLIGSSFHKLVIVLMSYNSCLNPIVYAAWYPQFRVALKEMVSGKLSASSGSLFEKRVTVEGSPRDLAEQNRANNI